MHSSDRPCPFLLPSLLPRQSAPQSHLPPARLVPYSHHVDQVKPALSPPGDGSSPFSLLPAELVLHVMSYLDTRTLMKLRLVSRHLGQLALTPSLHRNLYLSLPALFWSGDGWNSTASGSAPTSAFCLATTSASPLPSAPASKMMREHVLPSARRLELLPPHHYHRIHQRYTLRETHHTAYNGKTLPLALSRQYHDTPHHKPFILKSLLDHVRLSDLVELSLPFSASYLPLAQLLLILQQLSPSLEKLDLRASSLSGTSYVAPLTRLRGLKILNLSNTGITALPLSPELELDMPWLEELSILSCFSLSAESVAEFLRGLPPSLRTLDLGRLNQVSFDALWHMRVTHRARQGPVPECQASEDSTRAWVGSDRSCEGNGVGTGTTGGRVCLDGWKATSLREMRVTGIDHLTRKDIRTLRERWEGQRRECGVDTLASYGNCQVSSESSRGRLRESTSWEHGRGAEMVEPKTPMLDPRAHIEPVQDPTTSSSVSGQQPPRPSVSLRTSAPRTRRKVQLPSSHSFLLNLALGSEQAAKEPHHRFTTSSNDQRNLGPEGRDEPWSDANGRTTIEVEHSAILESDDEEGYRKFIGEVMGGTVAVA